MEIRNIQKIHKLVVASYINPVASFEINFEKELDFTKHDKERIRLSMTTISEVITDWAITREIEK